MPGSSGPDDSQLPQSKRPAPAIICSADKHVLSFDPVGLHNNLFREFGITSIFRAEHAPT